jgi:hypothetical protein
MKISVRSSMAQRLGRIAAVGAIALLLAGSAAAPAAAKPMVPQPKSIAGALYYVACLAWGGKAAYVEFMGVGGLACELPSGDTEVYVGDD